MHTITTKCYKYRPILIVKCEPHTLQYIFAHTFIPLYIVVCLAYPCISWYIFEHMCISLHICVYPYLSLYIFVDLCTILSIRVYPCISLCIFVYCCISLYVFMYPCRSSCILVYLCISLHISAYPCISLSTGVYLCTALLTLVYVCRCLCILIYYRCTPLWFMVCPSHHCTFVSSSIAVSSVPVSWPPFVCGLISLTLIFQSSPLVVAAVGATTANHQHLQGFLETHGVFWNTLWACICPYIIVYTSVSFEVCRKKPHTPEEATAEANIAKLKHMQGFRDTWGFL